MGKRRDTRTRQPRQPRECPGERCVGAVHEEQSTLDVSSGRKDNEERISNNSGTEIADTLTLHCHNGDGNYVENPGDKREEGIGLLNPQAMDLTKTDHAHEKPGSRPEFSFDANSTPNLNADFKAAFQTLVCEFQEQKQVICQVQQENQKLHELVITERNLRTTQVMEFQGTMCIMKQEIGREIGQLRQDTNNVPAVCKDILETNIVKSVGQVFRHLLEVDDDLCKCRLQLDSATQDVNLKTRESEQLTANNMLLEEANSKLKLKADKIQQELCKEKEGHYGSYIDGSLTPFVWESMAKEMFSLIAIFNRVLSEYRDSNSENPAHSLIVSSAMWRRVRIARDQHWTYLLKNFICSGLFKDFEYETFLASDSNVLFLDQGERVKKCFDYIQNSKNKGSPDRATASCSARGNRLHLLFCNYFGSQIRLLPPDIHEVSRALRNYDQLIGIARDKTLKFDIPANQRSLLISLILAAKKVWDFHKLCLSFDPAATIFRVSPGDPFNANYMESIDTPDHNTVATVGFMVYPGFRLRKSIIKCQVYLTLK